MFRVNPFFFFGPAARRNIIFEIKILCRVFVTASFAVISCQISGFISSGFYYVVNRKMLIFATLRCSDLFHYRIRKYTRAIRAVF